MLLNARFSNWAAQQSKCLYVLELMFGLPTIYMLALLLPLAPLGIIIAFGMIMIGIGEGALSFIIAGAVLAWAPVAGLRAIWTLGVLSWRYLRNELAATAELHRTLLKCTVYGILGLSWPVFLGMSFTGLHDHQRGDAVLWPAAQVLFLFGPALLLPLGHLWLVALRRGKQVV